MSIDPTRTIGGDANFYNVVRQLRAMKHDHAHMALFAALFWDDAKLDRAERSGELPGQPTATAPIGVSVQ